MRHPKRCKIFEVCGKCKFDNCAYLYENKTDYKVVALENKVKELKLGFRHISDLVKERNTRQIEQLENGVNGLKSKDWRDAYDNKDNPSYDTTSSEESSNSE